MRTLVHQHPVDLVKIANSGSIVSYCSESQQLFLYTVNGQLEAELDGVAGITHMLTTKDGKYLVTGDNTGSLCIRSLLRKLELVHQFKPTDSPIRSLAFTTEQGEEKFVLA